MTSLWLLLLAMASRHYGVYLAPAAQRADVWNILGSAVILALAVRIVVVEQGNVLDWAAVTLLAFHELPVIASSVAWMVAPWDVPEGEGQLSSWVGLDLARLGALLVMLALAYIVGRQPTPANSDR